MVDTDRSGGDDEVQEAQDCVAGMVEDVEDSVSVVSQQFVVNHVGMDGSPVDDSHEHGQVTGDRLYCPGDLQENRFNQLRALVKVIQEKTLM